MKDVVFAWIVSDCHAPFLGMILMVVTALVETLPASFGLFLHIVVVADD